MSKLSGKLSYKQWCILKHSLRDQIEYKEKFLQDNPGGVISEETLAMLEASGYTAQGVTPEQFKVMEKELAEEKITLEEITTTINSFNITTKAK